MSTTVAAWRMPRSVVLERTAYTLAGPLLAAAPNMDPHGPLNAVVLAAGAIAAAWSAHRVHTRADRAGRTLIRLSPLVVALGLDVAAMQTGGWGWDALLATGWALGSAALAPLSRTRRRVPVLVPELPPTQEPQPTPVPVATEETDLGGSDFTRGVRHLWKRAGSPGRTVVVTVDPHEGTLHDFTMLLRAEDDGRAIGDLKREDIAAAFGVDPSDVRTRPVKRTAHRPGGPGWLEVDIIPDATSRPSTVLSDAEWWGQHIGYAKGPIAGTVLINKGRDKRGFTYWIARTEDGGEPMWDTEAVCDAMGAQPSDGRVHCFEDGDQVLVQVWDSSPLAQVYDATRELLTPGPDGRYVVGFLENGQPARGRVYTPRGAAHDMFIAPSGGGKTELLAAVAAAYANWGAVVMVAAEAPDGKTRALATHVARLGYGPLYIIRLLRMLIALIEIRGEMVWADGGYHDWSPDAVGCPYTPLKALIDEYLSATRHEQYGAEITSLGEQVTVKGRKYGLGLGVGSQSAEVQDGFTRLMAENIRENSIPIMLRTPPGRITDEFKALGFPRNKIPEALPRTFVRRESTGRLDRIMKGVAEPAVDPNTGGVGWIIEGTEAPRLRTLRVFHPDGRGIDHLFPDLVAQLTDHEVTELTNRGLLFDWTLPPQPGEFGDDEDDDEDGTAPKKGRRGKKRRGGTSTAGSAALAEAAALMSAIDD